MLQKERNRLNRIDGSRIMCAEKKREIRAGHAVETFGVVVHRRLTRRLRFRWTTKRKTWGKKFSFFSLHFSSSLSLFPTLTKLPLSWLRGFTCRHRQERSEQAEGWRGRGGKSISTVRQARNAPPPFARIPSFLPLNPPTPSLSNIRMHTDVQWRQVGKQPWARSTAPRRIQAHLNRFAGRYCQRR